MKFRGFEDLVVWQKGHALVLDIYQLTKYFPQDEKFGLSSQLRRSAVSVCANIVEGNKKSKKEFLRYLDIAFASLEETRYYLILSKDLQYCSFDEFQRLSVLSEEIGKMINGLISKLRNYSPLIPL